MIGSPVDGGVDAAGPDVDRAANDEGPDDPTIDCRCDRPIDRSSSATRRVNAIDVDAGTVVILAIARSAMPERRVLRGTIDCGRVATIGGAIGIETFDEASTGDVVLDGDVAKVVAAVIGPLVARDESAIPGAVDERSSRVDARKPEVAPPAVKVAVASKGIEVASGTCETGVGTKGAMLDDADDSSRIDDGIDNGNGNGNAVDPVSDESIGERATTTDAPSWVDGEPSRATPSSIDARRTNPSSSGDALRPTTDTLPAGTQCAVTTGIVGSADQPPR